MNFNTFTKERLLLLLFFLFTVEFSKTLVAEYYSRTCLLFHDAADCQKAGLWQPSEPSHRLNLANVMLLKEAHPVEATATVAYKEFVTAYNLNPQNSLTLRDGMRTVYLIANADPVTRGFAQEYLNFVADVYPKDVGVLVVVADYQKRLNFHGDYADTVSVVKSLRPDLLEWYPSLSVTQ